MKTLLLLSATAALFAGGASAQDADRGRAQFVQADVNNDGRLSRVEFDAAREGLFARADANDDARLTLSELRALRPEGAPRPQRRPSRDRLQQLRGIDRNGDRAIDIAEFRAVGQQRFSTADADRDGYIDRDEIAGLVGAMGLGG